MKKILSSFLFLYFFVQNLVVLAQKPINISCIGSQTNACNLVCFGDFEGINSQKQWDEFSDFEISDNKTTGFPITGMIQTPDLYNGANIIGTFGGFGAAADPSLVCSTFSGVVDRKDHFAHIVDADDNTYREGFALPLKEPLVAGKNYQLSFDFYTGCNNQLNILLAENKPCDHTISSYDGFPNDAKTALQKIDCGTTNSFTPSQTIFHTTVGMDKWQQYSTNITVPVGSNPIAYIIFYAHFNSNKANNFHKSTSTYYDDIRITEIPDAPIIIPTVIKQCLSGEIEIDYEVSVNSSKPQFQYSINLEPSSLPAGITLSKTKGNFTQGFATVSLPDPKGGLKKTFKLVLDVAPNIGSITTILMEVSVATPCIDLPPQIIPVPINLIQNNPDFTLNNDCTILTMEATTKTGTSDSWNVTLKNSATVIGTATGITATLNVPNSGVYTLKHTLITPCGTFVASKDITVSCTTPICPCANKFNIGQDKNSITSIKNTPFYKPDIASLSNSCVSLQGTLVIDADFQFINVNMKMGENALILVKKDKKLTIKGTNFNLSQISACTKMWKGIQVESNATLDFTKTTIEDAYDAILLRASAKINIKGNLFRKNDTGIRFDAVNPGDQVTFLDKDGIMGNVFTCLGTTLIAPKQGQISSCGIYVANGSFRVGPIPTNNASIPVNSFWGLNTGIYCTNSKTVVNKAEFRGTEDAIIKDRYLGQGIVGNGSATELAVKNCVLENLSFGIVTRFSNQTIDEGNTFTNMLRAIECDAPTFVSIKNNTIRNIVAGIYLYSSSGASIPVASEIAANTIIIGKTKWAGSRKGISLYVTGTLNADIQNPLALVVRDNKIYDDNEGESQRLIEVKNSQNIKLIHNDLYATTFVPPGGQAEIGFDIWGTNQVRLRDNTVYGKDHQVPFASIAIQGAIDLRLCCNTMTKGSRSLMAQNLNFTFIRNSNFEAGLSCQFPATKLSVQNDAGNLWTNSSGAHHAGGVNVAMYNSYIKASRFEIKTICGTTSDWANGYINPNLLYCNKPVPFGKTNEDWFKKENPVIIGNTDCSSDPECAGYIQKKGLNNDEQPTWEDSISARGAYKGYAYGDATNWEMAKRLYEKLLEAPYLKEDNFVMDSFYNAANESNISKYALLSYKIKHLADLNNEETEALLELWNSNKNQEELLSIYAESGEDYNEVKAQIEEANSNIAKNHERYQYTIETILATKKTIIEGLLLDNEAIKATSIWEINEQKVNAIYFKRFIATESTSQKDIGTLATIANQCVASHGHCVLLARSLYAMYDRNVNFEMEQYYCGEFVLKNKEADFISDISLIQKNNSTVVASDLFNTARQVSIYPNPAQDELRIEIPTITESNSVEVRINSLGGTLLAQYNWVNNGKYDISRFSNGLYLCYVYENGRIIATKRITILK
jgi:hypothetical protein